MLVSNSYYLQDFPDGPVVDNLPSNAEGTGSSPGREALTPHASEHLSLGTDSADSRALLHSKRNSTHGSKKSTCYSKRSRHITGRLSAAGVK